MFNLTVGIGSLVLVFALNIAHIVCSEIENNNE